MRLRCPELERADEAQASLSRGPASRHTHCDNLSDVIVSGDYSPVSSLTSRDLMHPSALS